MNRATAWLVANHAARGDFALAQQFRLGADAPSVKLALLREGVDERVIVELAAVDVSAEIEAMEVQP